jgi:hypothetical protein
VSEEFIYKLQFDKSLSIKTCWVDPYTVNSFNVQRDNIFMSSSKYDIVTLRSIKTSFYTNSDEKLGNALHLKKKKGSKISSSKNRS